MTKSLRLGYHVYRSFWRGIDLLYPPACGGCDKSGFRLCENCLKNIVLIPDPKCEICGLPQLKTGICPSCKESPPAYHALRSWAVFDGPIRKALHRIKYRQDLGLGDALAAEMLTTINQLDWQIDKVIPVPLGNNDLENEGIIRLH